MIVCPIEPSHAPGLLRLFDGCSCRCFCRYFHFEGDKNDWLARCALEPELNRDELTQRVVAGHDESTGVVAIVDQEVVGWLKVAPRAVVAKAYEQRVYRALNSLGGERQGVYFLGCALVLPAFRHQRVAERLVAGALELARARGAQCVEAFPRRPRETVSDEELWAIPCSALERNGFTHVDGEDPYPVLRRLITPPEDA